MQSLTKAFARRQQVYEFLMIRFELCYHIIFHTAVKKKFNILIDRLYCVYFVAIMIDIFNIKTVKIRKGKEIVGWPSRRQASLTVKGSTYIHTPKYH